MTTRAKPLEGVEILYTTAHVRTRIRAVMSAPGRRVAVAAFVGEHAEAYVSKATGLEVYCWPQGASTSAAALRRLINEGATVRFVDRLHMKVYWSATRGAVVTSANLSTNALGAGDLKEAGVFIPRGLDIERLLRGLRWRDATAKELDALEARNKAAKKKFGGGGSAPRTFLEWFRSRPRTRWMLATIDGYAPASKRARQAAREELGASEVEDGVTVSRGSVAIYDFILVLDCVKKEAPSISWLYVHHLVRVERSEKAYQPGLTYQAVQIHPQRACPPPPFVIDAPFRRAVRAIDWATVGNEWPKAKLLRRLADGYQSET